MATYYIEVDTYWQNSNSHFVGPFNTREAAEAWIKQPVNDPTPNVWLSTSLCGGDIRDAWRVYPSALSKTEAKRRGMRDSGEHNNTLSPSTSPTARDLSDAVRWLREVYS